MTIVNAEVLAVMGADEARAKTDRVKVAVEATWELIKELYVERAWAALGYSSWDDYCTREFGSSRLRLPREERQEVVASLRDAGLSLRAIASATGIDRKTVRGALEVGEKGPPDPEPPTCDGCGNYQADCVCDEDGVDPTPIKVQGTDGKSYPATPKTTRNEGTMPRSTATQRIADAVAANPPNGIRLPVEERAAQIRALAAEGHLASQIAEQIGIVEPYVRELAGRFDITLPDKVLRGMKKVDLNDMVDRATDNAGVSETVLDLLAGHYGDLDRDRLEHWASSLSESIRSLTTLRNNIKKELTHG